MFLAIFFCAVSPHLSFAPFLIFPKLLPTIEQGFERDFESSFNYPFLQVLSARLQHIMLRFVFLPCSLEPISSLKQISLIFELVFYAFIAMITLLLSIFQAEE